MPNSRLTKDQIIAITKSCGAADAGLVSINNPSIADQKDEILKNFPFAKTLISFVVKMNPDSVRAPSRSIANRNFHLTVDDSDIVARELTTKIEDIGFRAATSNTGFPMEMDNWPGKIWVISHKPIAVAAGLGKMGIHRNVIHRKFGNFILLGTVVSDIEVESESQPIDFNPCLECKLCVAACPTGAIHKDGYFDFGACYTHNYHEFMGGFSNWIETIADSKNSKTYRKKFSDQETVSFWQSLSFGAQYKAAYCIAVCPAGEDIIGQFNTDKKTFLEQVVDPLKNKEETIFTSNNSDATEYVKKRFPNKTVKVIGNSIRVRDIEGFLKGAQLTFQKGKAKDLSARYHFLFRGHNEKKATITIENQSINIRDDFIGNPDLFVSVDANSWIKFLNKDTNVPIMLLKRQLRIKGDPRLLLKFGRCFAL
jgi:epoxyqueuosine reductase QueG